MPQQTTSDEHVGAEHRREPEDRPTIGGVIVREEDVEPVKGIRAVAWLFRSMAVLLLLLMVIQIISGVTGTVPLSIGVLFAEAVRLLIFAGLLWGAGDLAVLWVKSHHDIRATRILVARLAYIARARGEAEGILRLTDQSSRADREL